MQVRIAASLASWRARCAPHTHARRERGSLATAAANAVTISPATGSRAITSRKIWLPQPLD